MNWGHLFFNFSGRINRAKFWIAMLIYSSIYIVAGDSGYVTATARSSRPSTACWAS